MDQWLTANFKPWMGGTVIVYTDADGNVTAYSPTDPAGYFANITGTPPTHVALSALPCAAQGWQKIFDQWKATGKVS